MHLRQLELGLGADTLGEGGVTDHVAKRLAIAIKKSDRSVHHYSKEHLSKGALCWSRRKVRSYRSGSICSKALRLLWSRIRRVLTKPERSSFLGRNIDAAFDMLAGSWGWLCWKLGENRDALSSRRSWQKDACPDRV